MKVKIPKDVLNSMKLTNGRSRSTMWIAGFYMGMFMMSPNDPNEKKRHLCPIPKDKEPSFLMECEVVKIIK